MEVVTSTNMWFEDSLKVFIGNQYENAVIHKLLSSQSPDGIPVEDL